MEWPLRCALRLALTPLGGSEDAIRRV